MALQSWDSDEMRFTPCALNQLQAREVERQERCQLSPKRNLSDDDTDPEQPSTLPLSPPAWICAAQGISMKHLPRL